MDAARSAPVVPAALPSPRRRRYTVAVHSGGRTVARYLETAPSRAEAERRAELAWLLDHPTDDDDPPVVRAVARSEALSCAMAVVTALGSIGLVLAAAVVTR